GCIRFAYPAIRASTLVGRTLEPCRTRVHMFPLLLRVRRREPQSRRQNPPILRVLDRSRLYQVAGPSPADVRAGGLTNAVRAAGAVVRCATGDLNKPGTRRPVYAAHLSDVRRPPAAVQACRRTDTGRARRARRAKRARHPEAGAGGHSSI